MLESIFIVSEESREVLIEKHWGALIERNVCEYYWEEMAKYDDDFREVPAVINSPQYYIFHYRNDGVILLSVCQREVPPLFVIEFLAKVCELFTDYFGDTREKTLRAHFVTVYQLLEEVCDSGMPCITELNILKDMIPPPSVMNRLSSAMSGNKGVVVSSDLPEGVLSNVPWRRAGVKHSSNEIFFDITEEVDVTLNRDGQVVSMQIIGDVQCNCKLSGMPDIALTFHNPHMLGDARLHPSVRFARFASDRALSFVPPDGQFLLMQYKIKNENVEKGKGGKFSKGGSIKGGKFSPSGFASSGQEHHASLPIYIKPQISLTEHNGRVNVIVGRKHDLGKPIEGLVLMMPLPPNTAHADITANYGTVELDIVKRVCKWDIGKLPKDTNPMLTGTLRMTAPDASLAPEAAETNRRLAPTAAPVITVDFKITGVTISGLSVDSLTLSNENYKPYKGIRTATKAGLFQVRTG
mmetsp:Transcript_44982/g.75052  ORF Transcript_44982/g.75052 Transcript_44982/m.75052 type:complete len:467 (+) Transcript_44982:257-1657(+)|eukprot:CAMPEP_0198212002 /NCGR_PEP_ID=MMETSP1445-20131203/25466_1 /TAXON_ID=36898 /ORGANISM="Pyramimonas sp., Strain CCMP2087" /LENGTH=466 /DNA_ID=CAMNT_0043886373 /DNA_START=219 /DNA_END=1619 /DNA_ORIENTATION=-